MKKVVVPSIVCIALVPLAAGCGSSDKKKSDTGASTGASTQPQTSTSGGGGGKASVSIKDIKFNPHDITVKKGTTITWTNNDQVQHTVTKDGGPGPTFNGNVAPGATFKLTVNTPGKIPYKCTIHPGQTGTITVQ